MSTQPGACPEKVAFPLGTQTRAVLLMTHITCERNQNSEHLRCAQGWRSGKAEWVDNRRKRSQVQLGTLTH